MVRSLARQLTAAALIAMLVAPAAAQKFSDSYTFLKAVKDRKGGEATALLSQPGSTVINARGSDGESALHIVARERDLTWLGFLLGKGARPDIENKEGSTPLALAAQLGWIDGARVLLSRGAKVDAANGRGETPLIIAVQRRDIPMTRLLIQAGADPNRTDNSAGYSALDYAKRDARAAALLRVLEEAPAKKREAAGPVM